MSAKVHKALYAQIPSFRCKEGCTECCGPVPFSSWEKAQVKIEPGKLGRRCPYLGESGCLIYENRPLMCRLYGTVPEMKCPHKCRPEKMLSSQEGRRILAKYRKMAERP
ncbi:MAG: hypothetical protein IJD04_06050 [Desulfovibrionaceae bacterium]|nr:hypothetical protein [Desulfovibrionaceae bacterium]